MMREKVHVQLALPPDGFLLTGLGGTRDGPIHMHVQGNKSWKDR